MFVQYDIIIGDNIIVNMSAQYNISGYSKIDGFSKINKERAIGVPNSICGNSTCDTNIVKFASITVSVNTFIHDINNGPIADAIILDNDLGDIITGLTADLIIMVNSIGNGSNRHSTIGNNDYCGKMGLA